MGRKPEREVRDHDCVSYISLEQFESILLAKNLDTLTHECTKFCRSLGFHGYLYEARIKKPTGEIFPYIFSNYPESWFNKYLSSGYIDVDPAIEHCFHSKKSIPLVWHEQIFNTTVRKAFMEEAKKHGITSGLSVPIPCAQNEVALFSISNPINAHNCHAHNAQAVGAVYVFSSYLHEALKTLVFAKELIKEQPNLTSRETECLLWWADGKSVNDISNIVGTKPRTVRFHLDNVKMKLGVETKVQAIAQAYKLGMITV